MISRYIYKHKRMKTKSQLAKQRAILAISVALMQLDGKIDKATAKRMHDRINRAYVNAYFSKK